MTMSDLQLALTQCLSKDAINRKQGQKCLDQMKLNHQYIAELWMISGNTNLDMAMRQLAIVNIKNSIEELWTGLPSDAFIVSKIAHNDWPDHWGTFFDDLIVALKSSNINYVHGAMRVLADFVRDDLSDLSFPSVAPTLLPELFAIYSNESMPVKIRTRSVAIVREFIELIYMVKEEHPQVIENYLEPLLNIWLQGFIQMLEQPTSPENLPIKNEVLRTVVKLVRAFPKKTTPFIAGFMNIIWNELLQLQSAYQQQYLCPSQNQYQEADDDADSDGETHSIETILYSLLDFIQLVARKKAVRLTIEQNLPQMFKVLLIYLQITTAMEVNWLRDMNQFIQDDEEEAVTYNVRIAVEQSLINLFDAFQKNALTALFQVSLELFQEGKRLRESGATYWWKYDESCLLALGLFPGEIAELSNANGPLNLETIFTQIVIEDMKCNDLPFLQGRSLWFASQFAVSLPKPLVSEYLSACTNAIHSTEVSAAVQVFAMKATRGFLSALPLEDVSPFQSNIIEGLVRFSVDAKEDTLILLMETLLLTMKVSKQGIVNHEEKLSVLLLSLLNTWSEDVFIMELVQEWFQELASNELISTPFQTRMFPILVSAISAEQYQANSTLSAIALDLCTCLIQSVPDPLPSCYAQQLFPKVIEMMLSVSESGLLQNGQETLKQLVNRDILGIVQWSHNGRSGLDFLLEFIAKMLLPEESESSALFIGELITKLIQKASDQLTPYLPQLLGAVINRLANAQMPAFIETLVLVFCHLIQTQAQTVIDFLYPITLGNRNGLEILVQAWCESFNDFHGVYNIKLCTTSLIILFSTGDLRLRNIQVKGELIVQNQPKKIVTRSMARNQPDTFTTLSFPQKTLKLLIHEYQSQIESKVGSTKRPKTNNYDFNQLGHIESDDEEWEMDSEDPDPYNEESGDGDERESLTADPIYQTDLELAIKQFFREGFSKFGNAFEELCKSLSQDEQNVIAEMVRQ
ncbi:Importin 9 [Globomyces sp. JEL0801]|nr:Importin 9 [Globomyces sp. JEL0801]